MKQSSSLAVLLVTLLSVGLALFYWLPSKKNTSGVIPVEDLPHIVPLTKVVDPSCSIAQRYLPESEPVLSAEHLDWPAVGLECPRIIETANGRELWFWWINQEGKTGAGRALWSDNQWVPQPTPTMVDTDLPDSVSKRFACPTLLYQDGIYRMWLGIEQDDFRHIFYAESTDAKTWAFSENNPVLGRKLRHIRYLLTSPFVTHYQDVYQMVVQCGGQSRARICQATSPDGINWTMDERRVLENKPKQKTEIFDTPFLHHESGNQHLLFTHGWPVSDEPQPASDASIRNPTEILHTSSPTGTKFDFLQRRALLVPGGAAWRSHRVESPFLTREENRSVLYFTGSSISQTEGGSIGRAMSDCSATTPYPSQMLKDAKRKKERKDKKSRQRVK